VSAERTAVPDISVLIVSYNTAALVDACLRSLAATVRRSSYEVVVADNGSSDGSVQTVRQNWPGVTVLDMGANLGFARANNRALSASSGRYVLLLNSDTEVHDGALDELVACLDTNPGVGVAAPHLLNSDLTDQGTARSFPSAAAAVFGRKSVLTRMFPSNPWSRRYLVGRAQDGDTPFAVDWVSGACLMVRRSVIERVGALDEGFFMYWEDADWCRRIGNAGFRVFCVPAARVVHLEGQSSHGRPARLVWEFHRSVFRYYTKHHTSVGSVLLRPAVALSLAARASAIVALDRAVVLVQSAAAPVEEMAVNQGTR
jgi:N-acetylglucosaminyl-diphospho-decaprenol L-rhamnosyltransferase